MTDQELRELGRKFIDQQKQVQGETQSVARSLDPMIKIRDDARWDYIDPYRMGVFLATKAAEGMFSINFEHICKVCLNPAAFAAQKPQVPTRSRIREFQDAMSPPPSPPAPIMQRQMSEVPFEGFDDV